MKLATKSILPFIIIIAAVTAVFNFAYYKNREDIMVKEIIEEARGDAANLAKDVVAVAPSEALYSIEETMISFQKILKKYLKKPNAAYAVVLSIDRNINLPIYNDAYSNIQDKHNIFSVKNVNEHNFEMRIKYSDTEDIYEISVPVVIPKTYYRELKKKSKRKKKKKNVLILSEQSSSRYNFPEFVDQLQYVVKYAVTFKNVNQITLKEKQTQIPIFIGVALLILGIVYKYEDSLLKPLSSLILLSQSLRREKSAFHYEIKRNDELGTLSHAIINLQDSFKRSLEDLHMTNEYAQSLIATTTISTLFNTILLDMLKLKQIERGALLYWNESRKRFVVKETKNFHDIHKLIANDDIFIKWYLENRTVLDPVEFTKRFKEFNPHEAQRWKQHGIEVIIPLFLQDKVVGLLNLGKLKSLKEYTEEDMEFLKSLAQVAVIAIENLNLRVRAAQDLIMKKDLYFAQSVQEKLLPAQMPTMEGVEFAVATSPARNIGGDYYDFINLVEGTMGICIADVSGKGVPAALVMASTRSYLRLIAKDNYDCNSILYDLNNLLLQDTEENMFVTMFYAILDMGNKELYFSNAGHNYPLIYKNSEKKASYLQANGFPLGMMQDFSFEPAESNLESGDMLLFYTDGIVEAMNSKKELFGFERLEDAVNDYGSLGVDAFMKRFMKELKAFIGEAELSDDYTIMAIKIK